MQIKFYKEQLKDLPSDEEDGSKLDQDIDILEPKYSSTIGSQVSRLSSVKSARTLKKIHSRIPDQEAEKEQAKEKRL